MEGGTRDAKFTLEFEREADGRWIAEVPSAPGVMAYGHTKAEAKKKACALLLRVLAEEIEERKTAPQTFNLSENYEGRQLGCYEAGLKGFRL